MTLFAFDEKADNQNCVNSSEVKYPSNHYIVSVTSRELTVTSP